MPFEVPNPSNLLGAQSPHWLAIALNTGGLSFTANSSDTTPLSVIVAEMIEGTVKFAFRISDGFANNESLEIALGYVDLEGNNATTPSVTLDDTNTPSNGGTMELLLRDRFLPPGSVIALIRTYTAGGQANNPAVAVVAQFY